MKYRFEFMQTGGVWLGALRSLVQTMFICGNGETITWGSNEKVLPHPTMRQLEELGAEAVAAYHNKHVEPLEKLLNEVLQSMDLSLEIALKARIERALKKNPPWMSTEEKGTTCVPE